MTIDIGEQWKAFEACGAGGHGRAKKAVGQERAVHPPLTSLREICLNWQASSCPRRQATFQRWGATWSMQPASCLSPALGSSTCERGGTCGTPPATSTGEAAVPAGSTKQPVMFAHAPQTCARPAPAPHTMRPQPDVPPHICLRAPANRTLPHRSYWECPEATSCFACEQ
jgi:hypothetical protein